MSGQCRKNNSGIWKPTGPACRRSGDPGLELARDLAAVSRPQPRCQILLRENSTNDVIDGFGDAWGPRNLPEAPCPGRSTRGGCRRPRSTPLPSNVWSNARRSLRVSRQMPSADCRAARWAGHAGMASFDALAIVQAGDAKVAAPAGLVQTAETVATAFRGLWALSGRERYTIHEELQRGIVN